MNTSDTGSNRIASISNRFDNGVGFSSAIALLGPYQPPPLVPSCLTATIGATGPSGMCCVVVASASRVACGPAWKVAGTPCQPSSSVQTSHNGSSTRSVARITSTQ